MSIRQSALDSSAINGSAINGSAINSQTFTSIDVQITTDPTAIAPKVIGSNFSQKSYSFLGQAVRIQSPESTISLRVPVRIISSAKRIFGLLPGQTIRISARVLKSKEKRVAALLIHSGDFEVITEASGWARSLASIRLGLRSATGGGDAGALIPGMVLGDTSKQSTNFKGEMRRSGLTHLVAVSGANFAMVSGFVLWGMQYFVRRMKWRLLSTALFLGCFIALVRPSPSVLRAAAMAAVLLLARGTHRNKDAVAALGFAIGAVVLIDPFQGRDPGFALSVLATAGLLLFAPKVVDFASRWIPNGLAQALAPPIAATLFCAPVIVAISGQISIMSVLANVLAAPVVAPITILGFIAALLSPLAPWLSMLLILIIKPLATWITFVAHWTSQFSVISISKGVVGFAFVALLILLTSIFRKRFFIALLVTALCLTWVQRFPAGDWQVANCDVGQGDSLVINLGSSRGIVIDTGPDPELADRCLRQLGIKEIPLLILTHEHADHIAGLSGVKKNRVIGTTWFKNILRGTRAKIESNRGAISIEVMWPDGGTYSPNNSSIAVMVDAPDFTLFAGGDMEPVTQAVIAQSLRPVDIYKVCHHGSAYQDPLFAKALSPEISIISVGATNTYGHPSPRTVNALVRLGSIVLRTDRDGAVAITARNHRLSIRKSKSAFTLWRWG